MVLEPKHGIARVAGAHGVPIFFSIIISCTAPPSSTPMCKDKDVQELTFQAYMNKELVKASPPRTCGSSSKTWRTCWVSEHHDPHMRAFFESGQSSIWRWR